jgi:hypothetical protein
MTSLLPNLLTGVITGFIALAGVVYTQSRAANREDKRWENEETRLRNEREWQRELWVRDHRREAHVAFLAEQHRLDQWMMMYTRVGGDGIEEPRPNWTHTLSQHFVAVQVFGSSEAATAAQKLFQATMQLQTGTVGAMMRADEAAKDYRHAVQRDLGLNVTDLPSWGDTIDS